MKHIYLFLLFIATSVALHAQTSGLYVYDGGYFIKNGDSWEEYRPKDKAERWASYNQYAQETNYFNVNNSQCTVSVPKATNNKFYIYRDNKWEPIYTTIAIYDWFPATETGRDVYAYDGGDTSYATATNGANTAPKTSMRSGPNTRSILRKTTITTYKIRAVR